MTATTMRGPSWLHDFVRPIRSGHRGAAGLTGPNTLRSYAEAIRLGCDLVEVDVQPVADGTLILLHDNTLLIDGVHRPVRSLSLIELRDRVSQDIPTLEEALALLRGAVVPLLDLKGTGFEVALGAAVRRAGVTEAIVCGTPLASLLATHAAYPAIATSLTLDRQELESLTASGIAEIPTDAVTVHHLPLTRTLVQLFHDQGITVIAWTVDDPARMRELVDFGVDGITTNRPDLLMAAIPRVR